MNIPALEKKIQKLQKVRDRLVAKAQAHSQKKLLALPKKVGLKTVGELIEALRRISAKGKRSAAPQATPATGKRKRAKITDATRAAVKKLAGEKKTGAQIAKALKISLPSVQNIKKALGLVKPRK